MRISGVAGCGDRDCNRTAWQLGQFARKTLFPASCDAPSGKFRPYSYRTDHHGSTSRHPRWGRNAANRRGLVTDHHGRVHDPRTYDRSGGNGPGAACGKGQFLHRVFGCRLYGTGNRRNRQLFANLPCGCRDLPDPPQAWHSAADGHGGLFGGAKVQPRCCVGIVSHDDANVL